ncbi:MAG: hypothetical protein OXE84_14325 [Rhodobacteraceae bacterium]|nr:hypothetical protein [Paracoccaceae bacterium]MCY4196116.1 hypothetical protein [Paracoccaceae bacterium]
MADRKSAIKRTPPCPDLTAMYEAAKKHKISDEDLREQAAIWTYGNAHSDPHSQKNRRTMPSGGCA